MQPYLRWQARIWDFTQAALQGRRNIDRKKSKMIGLNTSKYRVVKSNNLEKLPLTSSQKYPYFQCKKVYYLEKRSVYLPIIGQKDDN
ncbi:hypothetical protein JK203_02050 [Gluconobacter cerinus]|uniref:hypothetical protein n=1 Tax=Gluconobacter cerinus TaxID=38307 RepID=UPI001B8C0D00|nr:hypothetical protein [Gluconobacter cerinus]MBS1039632.1 hypothetical protein [Gluconobacter cerinus]MBS1046193.1 hypothetical protein [Gluconobacter cerinus]